MNTKRSLLTSCIALFLCFAMLLGTTFAWFTDTVTSSGNKIKSGSLKLDLLVLNEVITETGTTYKWETIKDSQAPLFTYENWEPGYTDVTILKVENLGSLALKWEARFASEQPLSALAEVIDVYVKPGETEYPDDRANLKAEGWNNVGTVKDFINTISETTYGYLDAKESATLGIALKMRDDAGNEYQNLTLGEFDIRIVATQATAESDSFGKDYDENAQWPQFSGSASASAPVKTDSTGKVTESTTFTSPSGNASVTVPAGVQFVPGTTTADFTITEKETSDANILSSVPGQNTVPFDVHIEGVAEGNTFPIAITISALLPRGLNGGNYGLVHVEDDGPHDITPLAEGATPEHNTYTYDPATGDVTLYLASFSEVAVTAYSDNVWNGNYDFSWYENAVSYKIANADQLAALSAIVGGMVKKAEVDGTTVYYVNNTYKGTTPADGVVVQDSFQGKTITLICDINIGDSDGYWPDPSANGFMFYPIGYWNNTESYEKQSGNVGPEGVPVSSGFYAFQGTFDGQGHTISNFYQNTWEAFGDYNDGYGGTPNHNRDGFGLFGKVYGGVVKNLTVDNFSSDGEYTTTGVIAAYADCGAIFDNIAIINCNPRVYNSGNGGIVGCVGWYNSQVDNKDSEGNAIGPVIFSNITVDNSNKISALWGSYDVACGGIVGQYYPISGQTSAGQPKNGGVTFTNCHSSAVMDVYNDVCANYQYYAYRYSGLLIGSVRENVTIDGHVYPNMDGITTSGCTVHYGDWNDYYYCEIVANSLASYTHDHQMSRLTQVAEMDVEAKKYLPLGVADVPNNWKSVPTGWAHYVVVNKTDATTGKFIHGDGAEYATCYHFVNGDQHFHDRPDASNPTPTETVNGVEGVLKEDKQLIYREFNNLVTGYGWGVTSKGVQDVHGVEILENVLANSNGESYVKFESKTPASTQLLSNHKYLISDFFTIKSECGTTIPKVILGTVTVSAVNLDTNDQVVVKMHRGDKWETTYIEFINAGKDIALTIQDYYYCTPTTTSGKYSLQVSGQFLLHNDTFSQKDDFSEEWIEGADNYKSNFETSGKTTYYYIDRFASGTSSRTSNYFYVETDITIHGTTNGDQWAKIGFMSGNHYKDVGQTESQYRMSIFYLAVNRGTNKVDANGETYLDPDTNDKWNWFGLSEIYNKYGWGWNIANDTIYSDADVYKMSSTMYGDGNITFGETFKIGLLRDGTSYHFFVDGQYAYTYQIDPTSELYGGRNVASDIGFFHFNCQATYSNYRVYRFADRDSMTNDGVVGKLVPTGTLNRITSSVNSDWCYHSFTHYEAKDATCGEAGNIEYNYCVKCKLNYSVDEPQIGTSAKPSLKSHALKGSVEIPAQNNHTWNNSGNGNCCTNCGMYRITVNHFKINGDEFKDTETVVLEAKNGIVTYMVDKASLENVVPSHDYVKVNVLDNNNVDEITIYYSEVDVWDGVTISGSLSGSGDSAEDPYLIQSAADFAYFAKLITDHNVETQTFHSYDENKVLTGTYYRVYYGKYFKLTKSIDLGKYELLVGYHRGWNDYSAFGGTFDGNNYTISGIAIDNTNDGISAALFGCVNGGTVKNLTIKGTVSGKASVAGLVSYTTGASRIENVISYVNLTQKGTGSETGTVGGIVANHENSANNIIINCVNYGDITSASYNVGGITGSGGAQITNCVNWGDVIGGDTGIGGISGTSKAVGTISGCINYGLVKTTSTRSNHLVGGIVGNMQKERMDNCVNYGEVVGPTAGGIVGGVTPTNLNLTITGCANHGNITGTSVVGDISGTTSATVSGCANDGTVTVKTSCAHVWSAAPVTVNGIVAFDCANCTATILMGAWDGKTVTKPAGSGTSADDPFLITSAADLAWIAEQIEKENIEYKNDATNYFKGKYFKMTANIDLNNKSLMISYWNGSGDYRAFGGTFDGNNYSITNLNIEASNKNAVALFRAVSGTVKNLTVSGNVSGQCIVGGIVGRLMWGGPTVENCVSYVNVNGKYSGEIGGIVGGNRNGTIKNCVNYGSVKADNLLVNANLGGEGVGGIAGTTSGIITGCKNYGDITGYKEVGGIYGGIFDEVDVTSCENYGNVTRIWDGSVSNSLASLTGDAATAGTEANPYLISSGADLAYLDSQMITADTNYFSGVYFMMTNNIDLNGYSLTIGDASGGWGTSKRFCGTFDGNSYSILNLKIENSTAVSEGLFPLIYQGTVKNLTVHGSVSGSGENIGGIVGFNHRGTLENCVSYVNVTSTGANAGGLVGLFNYASEHHVVHREYYGTVKNCVNYGSVSGAKNSGGLAGQVAGYITNCANYGTVTGTTTAGTLYGCVVDKLEVILTDCENEILK